MRKRDGPPQLLPVEVPGGGAKAEFLPREIHGVRPIAERHFQPLPVPGGGEQLKIVTNNFVKQQSY